MPLYCMCDTRFGDGKGLNHNQSPLAANCFGPPVDGDFPSFSLEKRMECIKTGAAQIITKVNEVGEKIIRPSDVYQRHWPNVDVFRCKNCGVTIVKE